MAHRHTIHQQHFGWANSGSTRIGPDLMVAARDAVRSTLDWLTREHGMPAIDAHLLCSVCGDLRISEIVDVPNWTVSFYFPRMVLE